MNILPIGIGPNDPNLIQGLGGEGDGYGLCEQPYACEAVGSVSMTEETGEVRGGGGSVRWQQIIPGNLPVFVDGTVSVQQGYTADAQGLVVKREISGSVTIEDLIGEAAGNGFVSDGDEVAIALIEQLI